MKEEKKLPTTPVLSEIDLFSVNSARQKFLVSVVSMGWWLAVVVLIPIYIGVKLDKHFHSSPLGILLGLAVAAGSAVLIVWQTVKSLNKVTDQEIEKTAKSKTPGRNHVK
jgi:F0F1-type ATP synthase assembly protein I